MNRCMNDNRTRTLIAMIVLGAIFVFSGCGADEPTDVSGNDGNTIGPDRWSKTTSPGNGSFYISATSISGDPVYRSGGAIYSDTTGTSSPVNGGTMTAGGLSIQYSSSYNYLSLDQAVFGSVSTWGLAGDSANGIPAFTDSMYVPALIEISSPSPAGSAISRSTGFTVQWNQDSNNDSVVVGFRYDVIGSRLSDSTLSDAEYRWFQLVPDNGSCTIPSSALNAVPVGGYIGLVVVRGAGKLTGSGNFRCYIYGTTLADRTVRVGR